MLRRQSALKSQVKEEQQVKFVYKLIDGVVLAPTSAIKVTELQLAPAGVSNLNCCCQDLLEQLVRLHALADPVDVNPLVQREVCPACPGQLVLTYGGYDLLGQARLFVAVKEFAEEPSSRTVRRESR